MESEQYFDREKSSRHFKKMTRLIDEYSKTGDIHVSRTLDQSYYEMMEDTAKRDHDQVVYRYTSGRKGENTEPAEQSSTAKLLMVNQLWIWRIDDSNFPSCSLSTALTPDTDTIITASPERWHEGDEEKFLSGLLRARPRSELKDRIAQIVLQCIQFPEEPYRAGLDELYTSIFERSIAIVVCPI